MKTVVLASQKGGAGKTTLAAHLAVAIEAAGDGPAVLIDTDPQGSLSAWWNTREDKTPEMGKFTVEQLPTSLRLLRLARIPFVVIDTPPAITASIRAVLDVADLVLIPARPSPHDLRAIGSTVDLAHDAGKPFAFVVTQAKPQARLTAQAVAELSQHGAVAPAIVSDRVDYAASMIDGRTVLETDPKSRSAAEMIDLWAFVKARLNATTKDRKR